MINFDPSTKLGLYFGESSLNDFLDTLRISEAPKLERGDSSAYLSQPEEGIELCLTLESSLDAPLREYPEDALVLDNIRLFGSTDDDHARYSGKLPLELEFNRKSREIYSALGKPNWERSDQQLARWDLNGYCVFCEFNENHELIEVSVQLPVG